METRRIDWYRTVRCAMWYGVCWMVYCVVLSSVDSSSTQECGVYECDAEETQLNVDLLRCCCRESAKIKPRSIIHLSMQCQSDAVSLLRHVHTGTRTHAHTTPNRSHPPRTTLLANRIGMRRRSAVRFDPSHCREYQIALGGLRCLRCAVAGKALACCSSLLQRPRPPLPAEAAG